MIDEIDERVMSSDDNLIFLRRRERKRLPVMTVLAMIKDESTAKDNLKKSLSLLELDESLDTKDFQTIQDALRILEREDNRRQSKISTISGSVSIGKILIFLKGVGSCGNFMVSTQCFQSQKLISKLLFWPIGGTKNLKFL